MPRHPRLVHEARRAELEAQLTRLAELRTHLSALEEARNSSCVEQPSECSQSTRKELS